MNDDLIQCITWKEASITTDIESKFQIDTAILKIAITIYLSKPSKKVRNYQNISENAIVLDTEGYFRVVQEVETTNETQQHVAVPK